MKKLTAILLIIIINLSLCSCTSKTTMELMMEEWLEYADLEAEETAEELYEKALTENTLIIYSTTTRIYDVKESFEAQYPGLTIEIYDMRAYDLVEILKTSYENAEVLCDIVICSDDDGSLTEELLPLNIINKYVPYDIEEYIMDTANTDLLHFVGEAEQLFYNNEVYETCPITNWWQLTEEEWANNIYMNSPLRSHPAYGLLHAVIANSDAMADAYYEYYGEELEIPEGSCAGEIFWERLIANGVQFTTSSNEIVELIGDSSNENPPVGFMISSKIRLSNIGMDVAVAYDASPCDGVYCTNTVSIAGGSTNVNTAKLFIRWLLGETDGTGEGVDPYLLEGTWSVRTDIESNSAISLEDGNFWFNDTTNIIEKSDEIEEFWNNLIE